MRHVVSAACGFWLGLAGSLAAQSQPVVVVELFTSQGCSSCPPADEFMAMLADDPSVIGLALHVDYWDYIGWKDTFASPQNTFRQKSYARAEGSRTIYTPQLIVGGRDRVEGNSPIEVAELVRKHLKDGTPVALTLTRNGDDVVIHADKADIPAGSTVQLVRYMPSEAVDIQRGENAGRTVNYHNIVTSWQEIGTWSGDAPLDLTVEAKGSAPVVVLVQAEGPADVLGAARLQ